MTTTDRSERTYRSGVAARLAGVPVGTLRIWERRYCVIGPRTSEGRQRLYTESDIKRLTMIKQLVDMGHAIGTVAGLDTGVIAAMRATTWSLHESRAAQSQSVGAQEISVALVGKMLVARHFAEAFPSGALTVVGRCADPAKAASMLEDVRADIVIIELPMMRETDIDQVAAIRATCTANSVLVLYRFASSALVRRMRMAGYTVARATSDPAEVEAICLHLSPHSPPLVSNTLHVVDVTQPSPPRFDEEFLAELAATSQTIECECPQHLVELVLNLRGFERYSAECASRSPADVVLHLALQRAAGLARSIMEQALERVAIAEGIELPGASALKLE